MDPEGAHNLFETFEIPVRQLRSTTLGKNQACVFSPGPSNATTLLQALSQRHSTVSLDLLAKLLDIQVGIMNLLSNSPPLMERMH